VVAGWLEEDMAVVVAGWLKEDMVVVEVQIPRTYNVTLVRLVRLNI
jgi:hypothetical protein